MKLQILFNLCFFDTNVFLHYWSLWKLLGFVIGGTMSSTACNLFYSSI